MATPKRTSKKKASSTTQLDGLDNAAKKNNDNVKLCIETMEEVKSWVMQLGEDDRLIIILAAARMDNILKRMLQAVMIGSAKNDQLLGNDRPLGTFSSRILLAYRLGLISRDYKTFLDVLRKLRNDTAHAEYQIDLATPPYCDRIDKLYLLASKSIIWRFLDKRQERRSPHGCLVLALMFAVIHGEHVVRNAKPLKHEMMCDFDPLNKEDK